MSNRTEQAVHALDQPGSADESTVRRGLLLALLILLIGLPIVFFGNVRLPHFPAFATIHASFVLVVDAITAYLLLGQFHYQRRLIYAGLAGAYLFKSLIMLPLLLTFPEALKNDRQLIGGNQSAAWLWVLWHLLFPAIIGVTVLIHRRHDGRQIAADRVAASRNTVIAAVLALLLGITAMVTLLHERLPMLIDTAQDPALHTLFFILAGIALTTTSASTWLCWREGRRRQTTLHLWLTITLFAVLADIMAGMSTTARYTVGWYFGRIEAMLAASLLLLMLLNELNDLYLRLATTMDAFMTSNQRMASLLQEKEALVTDLQYSEAQIRQLAYYDSLTELPNRRLLLDRLGQALNQARRHHRSMAVMFMDLDRFKEINDTLGHDAGDKLLVEVARRMLACLRRGDTASRSGGDEFIIVLSEISHPKDAAQVAEKILAALRIPVDLDGHMTPVTISIGIAIFPLDSPDDLRDLMQKADKAMYVAKTEGRNCYRFYTS